MVLWIYYKSDFVICKIFCKKKCFFAGGCLEINLKCVKLKKQVLGYFNERFLFMRTYAMVECAIAKMAEMVKDAIHQADENRRSGARIEVKSPVLVVEAGSGAVAHKA